MSDKEDEVETKLEKEEGFPLTVFYCGVCKLPPEYCEYGSTLKECRAWLKVNNLALFEKFGEAPDVVAVVEKEDSEPKEEKKEEGDEEKEKKEVKFEEPPKEAPVAKNNKKKGKKEDNPKIKITLIQRNKKKHITQVSGLASFNIKPKDAAKVFANKYACGASVVKGPSGDVIDIQGDFLNTIVELITSKWNNVTENSIIFVEEKKKK